MPRPGGLVDRQRVPRIPRRLAPVAAGQRDDPGAHPQVRRRIQRLVPPRPGPERGQRPEQSFRQRRVDGRPLAVADPRPDHGVAQERQRRGVGREDVGVEAVELDAPFPEVTPQVVPRRRRQGDQPQPDRRRPEPGPSARETPRGQGVAHPGDDSRRDEHPRPARRRREPRRLPARRQRREAEPFQRQRREQRSAIPAGGGVHGSCRARSAGGRLARPTVQRPSSSGSVNMASTPSAVSWAAQARWS